ncbi:MAG: CoA transferase [Acidimicrobiia bacterium]|nr:CoA transferase [Acidimicrobiia bacterium]
MSIQDAESALDDAARLLGDALGVDGPGFLRERSEILGIAPAAQISAGGTCRLLCAGDGRWIAINLARRSDAELLAAWMGHEWDGAPWDAVVHHLETVDARDAVERAQMLGIPAAVAVEAAPGLPVRTTPGAPRRAKDSPLVVDLSALWAGPLCARLLGEHGARVIKVELPGRPDGARGGHPEFWDRMNANKEQRTLDLSALAQLLDDADVVITSARPRAIEQLGLDLERRVMERGLIWVAITGYGMADEWRDRVAFGDDAAVAGGLAVAGGGVDAPCFVGDAPADPLAGLHAASAAANALDNGCGAVLDVSMRNAVAAALIDSQYARHTDQEVA